jgi:hypothetical protein
MKTSNDTIGNRTRDLPACCAVPQPNAPQRAPPELKLVLIFRQCNFYVNGGRCLCAEVAFGCAPHRLRRVESSISSLGVGLFELTADLVVGERGGVPDK